jgi:hypothetical protein
MIDDMFASKSDRGLFDEPFILSGKIVRPLSRMELNDKCPQYEWIPVGEYDGIDLPDTHIDEDYIAWQLVECPEYNCEIS